MSNKGKTNGGGSKTQVQNSRTKQNQRGRKPCPRGFNCPYIDEYQHSLEFSHDSNGVSGQNNNKRDFDAFSGRGQRLGGMPLSWADDVPVLQRARSGWDDRNINFPSQTSILATYDPFSNNSNRDDVSDDCFVCERCLAKLPLISLESHLLSHSTNAASSSSSSSFPSSVHQNNKHSNKTTVDQNLRSEQDIAYEESVLAEIKERTAKEAAAAALLAQETARLEKQQLQRQQAESLLEQARKWLLPEPVTANTENASNHRKIISIRFTMPSKQRILRRFAISTHNPDTGHHNIYRQIYYFLLTQEELFQKKFYLRGMMQADEVIDFRQRDFDTLGRVAITENCAFLVIVAEDDEENETEIEEPVKKDTMVPQRDTPMLCKETQLNNSSNNNSKKEQVISLLDSAEKPRVSKIATRREEVIDLT